MLKHVAGYFCVSNLRSVMLLMNNERQDAQNEMCKKLQVQFLPYGRSIGSCICLTADLYVSHVFVYLPVIFFAGKSV